MERTLNVLTIDDERIVLDSVQKHLRKENFSLYSVLSVRDALTLMDTTSMDIILTDLMMPETDGLEFLQLMKERSPRTPVIMITGYATINTALQATKLGAFDYIPKPFTKSELVSVVKRAAELVHATEAKTDSNNAQDMTFPESGIAANPTRTIGEYGWKRLEDDGSVVLGAEQRFLEAVGRIQNIFLPNRGDELRLGGVYLRIFSADLRSHTVLTPFSGIVLDVNEKYIANPEALQHCPEDEWLVRLKPSKLELEISELGV